jgi:tRNA nucleotidyltransferase (CCA-adding enzyme)
LATKVNIEELVIVAKADFLGRTSPEALSGVYEAGEWLLEKAKDLKVQNKPLDNLLQGRDLIALGLEPSPEFKIILDEVYELQMEGDLSTKEASPEFKIILDEVYELQMEGDLSTKEEALTYIENRIEAIIRRL